MALVDRLYTWLEHSPLTAADQVLAAALEHAEPEHAERIAATLFKRGNEASIGGLIAHVDRLSAEHRTRALHATQTQPAAIAVALRSASARSRTNAIAALIAVPTPKMAYLLPFALRDGVGAVRDGAVRAGRQMAETFLDRNVPPADLDGGTPRRAYATERSQLVRALREILRTYDRHIRFELLEVCLWFADELEGDIWSLLESRKSNAGRAVQDHLQVWNTPRLAGFLLQCLARPEWRRPAQLILAAWQNPTAAAAVLRNEWALSNEETRRGLAGVNRPRWFSECGPELGRLPPEVRVLAPRWLCAIGIPIEQKVTGLVGWMREGDPGLRRAAVYALATLDGLQARQALQHCTALDANLAIFAQWVLAGSAATTGEPRRPAAVGATA